MDIEGFRLQPDQRLSIGFAIVLPYSRFPDMIAERLPRPDINGLTLCKGACYCMPELYFLIFGSCLRFCQ